MTVIGTAFIDIKSKDDGFEKDVTSKVGSVAKKAAAIFGTALAVNKGFDFLGDSVAEARESNKVAAQTAAAIKSTGGAAKVSAKDIDNLASSISRKTGQDDEAIASAENLLLTFTKVRNEAGKGNDVFNQATQTLVDMGAALGTDASGSAIQLGKALNDPIAGISALTRVGVTFTDQQKDQIKALVESGRTLDAQKIILNELNTEFGGSAAAQATAADRLKVTVGNIKEQIGGALIPILDKASVFLADKLPGAIDFLGKAFGKAKEIAEPIIGAIRQIIGVLFEGDFKGGGPFAEDAPFIEGLFRVRDIFIKDVLPVLVRVGEFVARNLKPILIGLGVAIAVIAAPVLTVVAALVLLYTRSKLVRDIVATVVDGLGEFVAFLQRDVAPTAKKVFDTVSGFVEDFAVGFSERFEDIKKAVITVLKVIGAVIFVELKAIQFVWERFGDEILDVVKLAFDSIKAIVQTAVRIIRDVIDVFIGILSGDWGRAWDALKDIPAAALEFVLGAVDRILRLVHIAFEGFLSGLRALWDLAWEGLKGVPGAVIDFIVKLPERLLGLVGDVLKGAQKIGGAIFDGIVGVMLAAPKALVGIVQDAVNGLIGIVNSFLRFLHDKLSITLPSINTPFGKLGGQTLAFPLVQIPTIGAADVPTGSGGGSTSLHLASGGIVAARQGGVPAILAEGGRDEAVIPLSAGLKAALERVGSSGSSGGPLIGQLVVPADLNDPVGFAYRVASELEAVAYRNRWAE